MSQPKYKPVYPRIAQLKTAEQFRQRISELEIDLPFDEELQQGTQSVFSKSHQLRSGKTIGNSFCILPMEGWDGALDGRPTDLTRRRWKHFAISGAKLLWGCEAVAVCHDGRANPNQLMINEQNLDDFKDLYQLLVHQHTEHFGNTADLLIGLQLTHSGRFCKPNDHKKPEPKILYHHPVLDEKFGLTSDYPLLSDDELDTLVEDYIRAAKLAQLAGFQFVDIKHCHGYLGHEFLSSYDRKGKYGGSFENRTRFLRSIVGGIRKEVPGLEIGVRVSAFDLAPFTKGDDSVGIPAQTEYAHAFGSLNGLDIDLTGPFQLFKLFEELDIELVCVTAGSPYYNPHIIRPALFPPSDGYLPPEDPLVGVARQIQVTAALKKEFPNLYLVGSAYSYLQEWLPNVAQCVLRNGLVDNVGLGRMVLSYPKMPADMLAGRPLTRQKICRTFSDCTTAPRNGLVSGCYPLDSFYKQKDEAQLLKELKL